MKRWNQALQRAWCPAKYHKARLFCLLFIRCIWNLNILSPFLDISQFWAEFVPLFLPGNIVSHTISVYDCSLKILALWSYGKELIPYFSLKMISFHSSSSPCVRVCLKNETIKLCHRRPLLSTIGFSIQICKLQHVLVILFFEIVSTTMPRNSRETHGVMVC